MTPDIEGTGECLRSHVDDGQNWLCILPGDTVVTMPRATQAVVLWVGDRMEPLIIDDNMAAADVRDMLDGARAHVWSARLRYWADALDQRNRPVTPTDTETTP